MRGLEQYALTETAKMVKWRGCVKNGRADDEGRKGSVNFHYSLLFCGNDWIVVSRVSRDAYSVDNQFVYQCRIWSSAFILV